jgi:hypothetical protein
MTKKDLANVTADLSALAAAMPTQRSVTTASPSLPPAEPAPPKLVVVPRAKADRAGEPEEVTQFSLSLRKGLRKQLGRLADDADMTMRAFVLNALKEKGLDVRADDLLDLRKDRR